jgi:hypothetical protein
MACHCFRASHPIATYTPISKKIVRATGNSQIVNIEKMNFGNKTFAGILPRKPEIKYILRSIMHCSLAMCPIAMTTCFEIGVVTVKHDIVEYVN